MRKCSWPNEQWIGAREKPLPEAIFNVICQYHKYINTFVNFRMFRFLAITITTIIDWYRGLGIPVASSANQTTRRGG